MIRIDQTDPTQTGNFVHPQWIITPLPNNKWCLVLSGVVIINFVCVQHSGWHANTVQVIPNVLDPFAFAGFDNRNNTVTLQTEQYACYGSLNSIFDKDSSVNAGFAVDAFYPLFNNGNRGFALGSGISLDVAVQDRDASLLRVGYYLMAIGTITSVPIPPIQ